MWKKCELADYAPMVRFQQYDICSKLNDDSASPMREASSNFKHKTTPLDEEC